MLLVGQNSFASELDFFTYLDTRLNADEFCYLNAALEAVDKHISGVDIASNVTLAKVFNDNRGGSVLAVITAYENIAANSPNLALFDHALIEQAYNTLAASETAIQIKNAKALILATQLIDQFDFIGSPADTAQPLQWPRVGAIDRNGQAIAADTIPAGIKRATAELAYFLLKYDLTDPRLQQHLFLLTSERVGESQSSFGKRINKKLPDNIMDLLKPYLLERSAFSSGLMF